MNARRTKPPVFAGALCALLGVIYASAVGGLLHTSPTPLSSSEPAPVRVRFLSASSVKASAHAATLSAPLLLETAKPLRTPKARTGQSLTPHSKAPVPSRAVESSSSPPEPAAPPSSASAAPPGPDAPPAHVDDLGARIYPEQPGGPTLVMALLVNAEGEVLSVKVMVPSAYPLQDVNYPLLLIGRKFSPPKPPLAPGQTRWIDLRIHYTSGTAELP